MDNSALFNSNASQNRSVTRVFSAVIENVSRERNTTLVTISFNNCPRCDDPSDTVRLLVNQDTVILDEQCQNIRAGELESGMTVDASFSTAMTRSLPPQAQAYYIQIRGNSGQTETTTGRIVDINVRDNSILVLRNQNPTSAIRFNLTNDTEILDRSGRSIRLSALRPGMRVRVEHADFMTASLPPQTTAYTIQIM